MALSIIVPVYNEEAGIAAFLQQLQAHVGDAVELLFVDGGSSDSTVAIIRSLGFVCLQGPRGRAQQMNFGAEHASGDYLLFLHCDTILPSTFTEDFSNARASRSPWGFFRLRLSGRKTAFRVIERAISWRSTVSGVGTGDQAIFVSRELWSRVGGYRDLALMEDVDLCKRLRAYDKPVVIPSPVHTSSRRWEQSGVAKTVALMWALRLGFYLGVDDKMLARWYK